MAYICKKVKFETTLHYDTRDGKISREKLLYSTLPYLMLTMYRVMMSSSYKLSYESYQNSDLGTIAKT